jgi:pimeloyl-ACP methyl ester carboxylesterase
MRIRGLAVAAVVAAVAGLGVGSRAAAADTAVRLATGPRIDFGVCDDPFLRDAGAECGFLRVPMDYGRPAGAKIEIAVSRIRHTVPDAQFQGVMLVNPGGPGGPGLSLVTLGQFVPGGAGDAYDWIGFDPRGVGASRPALSCIPDYFGPDRPDYIPLTRSLERTWLDRSRAYATACGRSGGELLRHLSTADAARDMESIRVGLGQRQINYYGFSYGTYLGQVYATLFPDRLRRAVFDSNVDPRTVWYQGLTLDQDVGFERNLRIWFGWLARYDSVYHLGRTEAAVRRLWYQVRNELRAHPAGGVVGPDEWTDVFVLAGYAQLFWTLMADAFAGWVHERDADTLIGLYQAIDGPGDDNGFATFAAVVCTDVQWPLDFDRWRRDSWAMYADAPFLTWLNVWFNAPCLFWPAPAGTPVRVDGRGVGGVLLVGETLDAATPFEGSLEVRRRFPNAVLLAEPGGTSHAATLFGNACVDNTIAAYLADGTLPARRPGDGPDAFCEPLRQPVPGAAALMPAHRRTLLLARR